MTRDSGLSRIALCILMYSALAVQTYRFQNGSVFYGEFVHWTGLQAVNLLLFAIAITPLRRLLPRSNFVRWLLARRRDIGIAVFVYAFAHTAAYLIQKSDIQFILRDAATVGMFTGWLALIVFLPLALTSNDWALRKLNRYWRTLHRWVYAGAVLTILHWILTAFDPKTAYIYMAGLIFLLAFRLWKPTR